MGCKRGGSPIDDVLFRSMMMMAWCRLENLKGRMTKDFFLPLFLQHLKCRIPSLLSTSRGIC